MKKIFIVLTLCATALVLKAQEYKIAKSSGKLLIEEVNRVSLEGTTGNEIIFSSLEGNGSKDKRADGLRAIGNMGYEDNTGLGVSVVDKAGVIEVHQLKKMDGPKIRIQVPKGVTVTVKHTSPYGSTIKASNMENEFEVSTVHSSIMMTGLTGPVNIRTVHGDIDMDFTAAVRGPLNIHSEHGHIDVTFPAGIKANMTLGTNFGEIFMDPALKLETGEKDNWVKYGSNKVSGKVNGGGLEVSLTSGHSNIYVRKK
ncbi:MAG: DUF4097 family beta strand repeat protein [Bacteroidetes bacterium]|nr:DUF4097 family beta strand repeat protein [Bacteroidota bacterium]